MKFDAHFDASPICQVQIRPRLLVTALSEPLEPMLSSISEI
jgi:hypothetical protein